MKAVGRSVPKPIRQNSQKGGRPRKEVAEDILAALATAGMTDGEIARRMGVSAATVRRRRMALGLAPHPRGGARYPREQHGDGGFSEEEWRAIRIRQLAVDDRVTSVDTGLPGPWPRMTAKAWLASQPSLYRNVNGRIVRTREVVGAPRQLR